MPGDSCRGFGVGRLARPSSGQHHTRFEYPADVAQHRPLTLPAPRFLGVSHQVFPYSRLVRHNDNPRAFVTGAQNVLHLDMAVQSLDPLPPDPPPLRTSVYSVSVVATHGSTPYLALVFDLSLGRSPLFASCRVLNAIQLSWICALACDARTMLKKDRFQMSVRSSVQTCWSRCARGRLQCTVRCARRTCRHVNSRSNLQCAPADYDIPLGWVTCTLLLYAASLALLLPPQVALELTPHFEFRNYGARHCCCCQCWSEDVTCFPRPVSERGPLLPVPQAPSNQRSGHRWRYSTRHKALFKHMSRTTEPSPHGSRSSSFMRFSSKASELFDRIQIQTNHFVFFEDGTMTFVARSHFSDHIDEK